MPTTDDDPFGALLGRLHDDEREAERAAERAEHAREDANTAFVRNLFRTDQDPTHTDQGDAE